MGCGASKEMLSGLDPEGWVTKEGEVVEGVPQCNAGSLDGYACFKHSQPLKAEDVLRLKVELGEFSYVGFAGRQYDPKEDAQVDTAAVFLGDGTTCIRPEISQDGEEHYHRGHLEDHIPKALPYDLALRCDKDGNVPKIQFNDDGVWHDFAPLEGRAGLKAGPWFPYLLLSEGDSVSDLRGPCAPAK